MTDANDTDEEVQLETGNFEELTLLVLQRMEQKIDRLEAKLDNE